MRDLRLTHGKKRVLLPLPGMREHERLLVMWEVETFSTVDDICGNLSALEEPQTGTAHDTPGSGNLAVACPSRRFLKNAEC